jgi:cytidine deaminase
VNIKQFSFTYKEYSSTEELPDNYKKLIKEASEAAKKSYAPYSNFHVGAAVLLDNDIIISGNNQENAAYPSGLCAERVTIFYTNAMYPNNKIKALAITAYNENDFINAKLVPPCGSCRQVILESQLRQKEPITLILNGKDKIIIIDDASLLLPIQFNKDFIKI